jgi:uncharacterized protein
VIDRPTPEALAELEVFLASPERAPDTPMLDELRGFLFTVASAPEMVPFPEVFDFILGELDTAFETAAQADRILGCIAALYNEINEGVLGGAPKLPPDVVFADDPMDNFEPGPLSDWARGFLDGHNWLAESWDLDLPEEIEQELGATMMVLSFFASRELAESFAAEAEAEEPRLESLAATCARLLPDALVSYALTGRTIYEAELGAEGSVPVRRPPPPGRNDPCPCGSGKKVKRCCGARMH